MTPVEALEQVVHYLDRARDTGFKAKAFVRALDVVRSLPADEVAQRAAAGTLTELDGIGSSSATVVAEALAGETTYLDRMESTTRVPITEGGAVYRNALRGDLHLHSRWSDGGATIEAMARTAMALGHEYMVLTDHSPRLTVAHGLSAERLAEQVGVVAELNERFAPFRILSGIEVDILEDGNLDHGPEVLSQLDLVVASVHNKLRMPSAEMTPRMIAAVSSPHVDILGHCTGRMIGKRDPSEFDAEAVFSACVQHHTAVEINCRPERLDPPMALLKMAIELGCWFSIDSDAHSTGQLEWQPLGCDRAAEAGVPLERVINTLPLPALLRWRDESRAVG
jgi:putative hydrolase